MEQAIITASQVTRIVASLLQQLRLEIGPEFRQYEDDPAAVADLGDAYPRELSGFTFGRFTVCERSEMPGHWHCRCACGVHKTVSRQSLVSGSTKSCGCLALGLPVPARPVRDLMGQRFGQLTVIDRARNPNPQTPGTWWECRCSCGGQCAVSARALQHGDKKSCGCLKLTTQFKPRTPETREAPAEWRAKSWAERKAAIWERARQAAA